MAEGHVRAEAAVAELAQLVAELRQGGLIERGRILARGARLLRDLTPKQRRTLAIEVGRHAAPQLVERITAEGGPAGDVDLSPAQIKAVFDMVARLDDQGAEELVTTLRDPDWQREALGLLATEGLDAVAESAGVTEAEELLGAGSLEEYETAVGREDFDEGEVLADAAWDPDGGENIGTELSDEALPPQPAEADHLQHAGQVPELAPPPAQYRPTMPELASYDAAGIDPVLLRFGSPPPAPRPPTDQPAPVPEPAEPAAVEQDTDAQDRMHERSWFGGGDLGIGRLDAERTSLSDRLVQLERPSDKLQLVNASADEIAAMEVDEQLGVLLAVPDGWVRRRALHRLLEASGISQASAPRLLRTLGHGIDRAWVAASMIEDGIATLDDLGPVLSDRARARLAARYEPMGV